LFLFLLSYGLLLFLLSAILYPSDIPESWDPYEQFVDMRRWFFGLYLCWLAVELMDTWLKDNFASFALPYAILMASWIASAVWGWIGTTRRWNTIIALYQVISLVAWIGYQLRDLDGSFSQ
jgi:hypothetical protein